MSLKSSRLPSLSDKLEADFAPVKLGSREKVEAKVKASKKPKVNKKK